MYDKSGVDATVTRVKEQLDKTLFDRLSKLDPSVAAAALLESLEKRVAELEQAHNRIQQLELRLRVLEEKSAPAR